VARGEFMPLALLADKAATPSELSLGGRYPRVVARARNSTFLPKELKGLGRCGCRLKGRSPSGGSDLVASGRLGVHWFSTLKFVSRELRRRLPGEQPAGVRSATSSARASLVTR
jgi:hypothetical protein